MNVEAFAPKNRLITSHKQLRVYQNAVESAMVIFELSRSFPPEEKYSLIGQIRRSSRSVGSNVTEAWRKRRYKAAFIAKLSDAEGEASETQYWIDIACRCRYISIDKAAELEQSYNHMTSQIIRMIDGADKWAF